MGKSRLNPILECGIDLTSISPERKDILVLRFDMDRLDLAQVSAIFHTIKDAVQSDLSVVAIPDACSLEKMDAARLCEIKDQINDLLFQIDDGDFYAKQQ